MPRLITRLAIGFICLIAVTSCNSNNSPSISGLLENVILAVSEYCDDVEKINQSSVRRLKQMDASDVLLTTNGSIYSGYQQVRDEAHFAELSEEQSLSGLDERLLNTFLTQPYEHYFFSSRSECTFVDDIRLRADCLSQFDRNSMVLGLTKIKSSFECDICVQIQSKNGARIYFANELNSWPQKVIGHYKSFFDENSIKQDLLIQPFEYSDVITFLRFSEQVPTGVDGLNSRRFDFVFRDGLVHLQFFQVTDDHRREYCGTSSALRELKSRNLVSSRL